MATRQRRLTDSPFDTLERTFALLVSGPNPLALDGTGVEGLPDRPIPLDELKARLLHPSTRFETRDAIVASWSTRAQREGGKWTVGLAGVLLPGLRRTVRPLVQACPGKADDIESETLAALRGRGRRVADPGRPRLAVVAALAGPQGRHAAAARPRWPSGPGRHRPGLGCPAPTVGPPRPGAGQGRAGRGHLRLEDAELISATRHRRHRPGRGRRRPRARLLGVPQAAPSGRSSPRRMGHQRRLSAHRHCPKTAANRRVL